jgi:hypothetical protein
MPIVKGGRYSGALQTFHDIIQNCCGQVFIEDSDNVVWLKIHFSGLLTCAIQFAVTTKPKGQTFEFGERRAGTARLGRFSDPGRKSRIPVDNDKNSFQEFKTLRRHIPEPVVNNARVNLKFGPGINLNFLRSEAVEQRFIVKRESEVFEKHFAVLFICFLTMDHHLTLWPFEDLRGSIVQWPFKDSLRRLD